MDVGVIGGQDGPAAVLASGNPTGLILIPLLIAAVAGAAIRLFFRRRKK
jgi:Na+-transporting methylmalonyl-CoA/oxaloacetate decarboxylase beta subunit